ncbi:MAG: GIY-YIG nuclease family protein [Chloroflexi bacterium]|nr:GIY-YIG nuclease family protein [Chloroflexota bacterium]
METITRFDEVIEKLPVFLNSLRSSPALNRNNLGQVPKRGIYAFYEEEVPIYVGRSDRLRKRLFEHSQPGSTHNSATFAFNLAVEEADKRGIQLPSLPRETLQHDPAFRELYSRAKERVSRMDIRVVEVTDPIDQTVFEVYAALELETPYNTFENH